MIEIKVLGSSTEDYRCDISSLIRIEVEGGGSSGGGSAITVDSELSSSSTNPVQNNVINAALNLKANANSVHNIPAGGTANQVLAKRSSTDYDATWVTQSGGGGGETITIDSDLSSTSENPVQNKIITQALSAKSDKYSIHTITTAGAVTQQLVAGDRYHFTGNLTSLTITLAATNEDPYYHFDFNSGSTPVVLTLPSEPTVIMPEGFSVRANRHYEITISDGYGGFGAWPISTSS